ncbi:DUF262 domain-containing HNH endonuclease family protein [Rhodococcus opacus]|uniref:DUF262 domain-containing protein n=1 Tax=Rhodococcus opacus TaxID=37919 RepID=UPI001FF26108|nr:DUF262 domain-containing protein [Rhodococcus opacus]UOT04485.1 DUF262 domain-containing HNH endonuclease family protein [Rhodococcus opacus]
MKIESEDIDIESLLSGRYFSIPRFQRPYSWDEENIQDLWNDVISSKGEDYFIGSMVVFKQGKQEFGVVDGQQRLTTITILLCAIRDSFASLGEEDLAQGLHQLIERKNRSNKNEYVLKTETSFPFFQEHIQKFGPADVDADELFEERALRRASDLLAGKIGAALGAIDGDPSVATADKLNQKISKLTELRESVLNLKLIFVTLENEDDAYLIFETLNTRGKDLAVTDLVKNHFTKNMKSKGSVDSVKIKWTTILETIHNSSADISPDSFIYHYWASRHEAVPLKRLFPVMKRQITKSNAKDNLDSLVGDSKLYRAIHEPSFHWGKNEARVADSLRAIQLFKLSQPTPALLSLVRSHNDGIIKLRKLTEAVSAIEKFHFSFTAVTSSRSSGGISGMYSAFARRLHGAKSSQEAAIEIGDFIGKLRDRTPSYDEFLIGFREIAFTNDNSKQKGLVRYILRKFSEHHSYKSPVDFDDLTIEHVAPQSGIGKNSWDAQTVGQLGNLIFLDQKMNEKLEEKPFNEKKRLLQEDGYEIPLYMLNATSWTPAEVREHTEEMAKSAYEQIWKV